MSKMADKRISGWADAVRILVAVFVLSAYPLIRLSAQVGHDPVTSPFRDILTRQSITLFAGIFPGNKTEAGVGPHQGPVFGIRLQTRLSGPIDLMATVASISTERIVIDPSQPVATRISGPIGYGLIAADLGLSVTLTGNKSWHGLAPYVGLGLGIITPTESRIDPGGYRATRNFTIAPTIGVRYHAHRSFALQLELRDNTIRYEWPRAYFFPTDASGNPLPFVLDPARLDDRDVTHNLTLSIGLSYLFNF
jgi:hypothetical protein